MKHIRLLFLSLLLLSAPLFAQKYFQMLRVDGMAYNNKQIGLASYNFGWRRICFDIGGGFAQGTDDQFLAAADIGDFQKKEKIRGSQTIYADPEPDNYYVEHVASSYTGTQFRAGFIIFFRNNDTLARHPMTGPHIGAAAAFMMIKEQQSVTYKADSTENRLYYSGVNKFNAIGAATHIGWQFAFFRARLYLDLRANIIFAFPFMPEPNLNSPFAGNRIEGQIGIGWHFVGIHNKGKENKKDPKETEHEGGGIIRSNL